MQIEIITLFVSLILSAFFSGTEVAFFSISEIKLKQIVKSGARNAKMLESLKKNSDKFIVMVLVGNNITNILSTAIATKLLIDIYGENGVIYATTIMTILILFFGEIIPKAYCAKNARTIMLLASPIYKVIEFVLFPVIYVLEKITKIVLKLFGISKSENDSHVDEDIVKELVRMGEIDGSINKRESELIANVFEFDDTKVFEIMTPHEQAITVTNGTSIEDTLKIMNATGFSRIPVLDKDNSNHVIGIVHIKQLVSEMLKGKQTRHICAQIYSEPYFIPKTKRIPQLFKGFQTRQVHMAIVVNEFGTFEGIVTLEDVVEELVGEVYDETDVEEKNIIQEKKGIYKVKGSCYIEEFNHTLGTNISTEEEFDTITGFIMHKTGNIHKKGDKIKQVGLEFEVLRATKNRVLEFRVKRAKIKKATHP